MPEIFESDGAAFVVLDLPEPKYCAVVYEPDEDDPDEPGDGWETALSFHTLKEARAYSRALFAKGLETWRGIRRVGMVEIQYLNGDGEVEFHRMVAGKFAIEKAGR